METLIVILIVVGSFGYKIYSAFKEEMEKSSKRKPYVPHSAPSIPNTRQAKQSYKSPTLPNYNEGKHYVESYEIPSEVEKVKNEKAISKARIATEDTANSLPQHSNQHVEFDLRQAVIQAAILERPYK